MKIQTKVILAIILIIIPGIIILYVLSTNILLKNFQEIEANGMERSITRTLNALTREIEDISLTNEDWATWDDTYEYIQDSNEEYVDSNLNSDAFAILKIQDVMYVDNSREIKYSREFDFENDEEKEINGEEKEKFTSTVNEQGIDSSGIVLYENGIALYSVKPILPSGGKGEPKGYLLMARHITKEDIEALTKITQLDIEAYPVNDNLPNELKDIINEGTKKEKSLQIIETKTLTEDRFSYAETKRILNPEEIITYSKDKKEIEGYAIIKDSKDKPLVIIAIKSPREIYSNGKLSVNYAMLLITIMSIILSVLIFFIINKIIILRLIILENEIKSTGEKDKFLISTDNKNDEISSLANSINEIYEKMSLSKKSIKESSKQLEKEKENLKKKVKELEKFQRLTSDREQKMIELKKRLSELEDKK